MLDLLYHPHIGVTGPNEGGWVAWWCTRFSVWLAGGIAVRITPKSQVSLEKINGLILGGGADIHPSRYKEELLRTIKQESRRAGKINLRFLVAIGLWLARKILAVKSSRATNDPERDELEFRLLKEAASRGMPVLGICRGGQLINVFWGGSLYQDIQSFYVEAPQLRTIRSRKLIHIEAGTTLSRILEKPQVKVNSLHDQCVKELGRDLRVAARESNGVIQAIEHRHLPFVVGVQWHPEFLPLNREQRRVFHHFVEAAKVHREVCPREGIFEPAPALESNYSVR